MSSTMSQIHVPLQIFQMLTSSLMKKKNDFDQTSYNLQTFFFQTRHLKSNISQKKLFNVKRETRKSVSFNGIIYETTQRKNERFARKNNLLSPNRVLIKSIENFIEAF